MQSKSTKCIRYNYVSVTKNKEVFFAFVIYNKKKQTNFKSTVNMDKTKHPTTRHTVFSWARLINLNSHHSILFLQYIIKLKRGYLDKNHFSTLCRHFFKLFSLKRQIFSEVYQDLPHYFTIYVITIQLVCPSFINSSSAAIMLYTNDNIK